MDDQGFPYVPRREYEDDGALVRFGLVLCVISAVLSLAVLVLALRWLGPPIWGAITGLLGNGPPEAPLPYPPTSS